MTGGRPTGTVTFLFTDIEGSTERWQAAPRDMATALERHDAIVRDAIEDNGGQVFATGGDGFAAAFERAADALAAAVAAQDGLVAEPWPATPLRVRMGLHTGEVVERDQDYFGPAVNLAARVMAAGHGGQVLATATTVGLAGGAGDGPVVVDLGEHQLRGVTAPVRILQLGTGAHPPLRTEARGQSNLPAQLTDLVGRGGEVAEVGVLVQEHRLVTLAGPGGIGKTRLAIEVATAAEPDHADGVWFVDLAAVNDDADVAAATVTAIRAAGLSPGPEALARHLATRQVLLVLDNCEHVIEGVVELAELVLRASQEVRLLCTSRELLDLPGEVVHWVGPLALPDAGGDDAAALASASVQLFEERARAVRPEFVVDAGNIDDVVEVCRRLDGMPLAVELAAARVASMSVADIKERLDQRFRLLSGGRRRQDRHRTLQAAVGWSYDLLEAEAQRIFRHLAVFPGSFDLTAAAAAVGGDDLDVADAVSRLAERSLVVHDPATGRYRLLESLRQYGLDRLAEADETEIAQGRFAAHFLALADHEAPRLADDGFTEAHARLRAEGDSLRGTAEWCQQLDRYDDLAALGVRLWVYYVAEAPGEALAWLLAALDADAFADEQRRYDASWATANLSIASGDLEQSMRWSSAAHALEGHPDVVTDPWSWYADMLVLTYTNDWDALDALCHRMSDCAVERGDASALHFARSMALIPRRREDPGFAEALGALVADAEASRNPMWMAQTLTCATAGLFAHDGSVEGRNLAVELFERHPTAVDAGGFMQTVIAATRSLALSASRPLEAILVAVSGARQSDRLGVDYQLAQCLFATTLALADAGLLPLATALWAHLRSGGAHGLEPDPWSATRISELLADVDAGPGAGLLDRRALFALLDEAERLAAEAGQPLGDATQL